MHICSATDRAAGSAGMVIFVRARPGGRKLQNCGDTV